MVLLSFDRFVVAHAQVLELEGFVLSEAAQLAMEVLHVLIGQTV